MLNDLEKILSKLWINDPAIDIEQMITPLLEIGNTIGTAFYTAGFWAAEYPYKITWEHLMVLDQRIERLFYQLGFLYKNNLYLPDVRPPHPGFDAECFPYKFLYKKTFNLAHAGGGESAGVYFKQSPLSCDRKISSIINQLTVVSDRTDLGDIKAYQLDLSKVKTAFSQCLNDSKKNYHTAHNNFIQKTGRHELNSLITLAFEMIIGRIFPVTFLLNKVKWYERLATDQDSFERQFAIPQLRGMLKAKLQPLLNYGFSSRINIKELHHRLNRRFGIVQKDIYNLTNFLLMPYLYLAPLSKTLLLLTNTAKTIAIEDPALPVIANIKDVLQPVLAIKDPLTEIRNKLKSWFLSQRNAWRSVDAKREKLAQSYFIWQEHTLMPKKSEVSDALSFADYITATQNEYVMHLREMLNLLANYREILLSCLTVDASIIQSMQTDDMLKLYNPAFKPFLDRVNAKIAEIDTLSAQIQEVITSYSVSSISSSSSSSCSATSMQNNSALRNYISNLLDDVVKTHLEPAMKLTILLDLFYLLEIDGIGDERYTFIKVETLKKLIFLVLSLNEIPVTQVNFLLNLIGKITSHDPTDVSSDRSEMNKLAAKLYTYKVYAMLAKLEWFDSWLNKKVFSAADCKQSYEIIFTEHLNSKELCSLVATLETTQDLQIDDVAYAINHCREELKWSIFRLRNQAVVTALDGLLKEIQGMRSLEEQKQFSKGNPYVLRPETVGASSATTATLQKPAPFTLPAVTPVSASQHSISAITSSISSAPAAAEDATVSNPVASSSESSRVHYPKLDDTQQSSPPKTDSLASGNPNAMFSTSKPELTSSTPYNSDLSHISFPKVPTEKPVESVTQPQVSASSSSSTRPQLAPTTL